MHIEIFGSRKEFAFLVCYQEVVKSFTTDNFLFSKYIS